MNKTKKIVFISIYVSLALVLDYIKSFIPFLNMASGGSINIALIPIVLCSFHLGVTKGALAGLLWWLVSSILGLNPYYLNIFQYLLDYVIPSFIIGMCSLFYKKKNIFEIEIGITLMMIIRTLAIIISGAVYWSEASVNSFAAWSVSLIYNLPYSIATLIMLLIVIPLLIKSLRKVML